MSATKTSENKRDYEAGRGQPPVHSRFKKGQSGNPRGPRPKNLPALLVDALDGPNLPAGGLQPPANYIKMPGNWTPQSPPLSIDRCETRRRRSPQ